LGCGLSPIQKVNVAEKAFTQANLTFASNGREGFFTNKDDLLTIQTLVHSVDAALDTAKLKALNGETIGFNLIWPSVSAQLDRLLIYVGKQEQSRKRGSATTKEISWDWLHSSPSLVRFCLLERRSWRPFLPRNLAMS
jgi:hypothetical protein